MTGICRRKKARDTRYAARPRASIPMYTSGGRRGVVGRVTGFVRWMRFNINGTDDKQRKQASSLPGEICLLLAGVQRREARHTRDAHRRGDPRRANRGYRHSWLPLQRGNPGGVGRATPERAEGEKGAVPGTHIHARTHKRTHTYTRDNV